MITLACEQPKERPISHWTGREIADEVVVRGIIAQISDLQQELGKKGEYGIPGLDAPSSSFFKRSYA